MLADGDYLDGNDFYRLQNLGGGVSCFYYTEVSYLSPIRYCCDSGGLELLKISPWAHWNSLGKLPGNVSLLQVQAVRSVTFSVRCCGVPGT